MEPIPPHRQLASAANIAWIGARVAQDAALSRYRLAKEACVRLDWHNPLGRPREMACRKQLLALQRQGRIVLPPARRAPPVYRAELAAAPVWPAFTALLGALGTIALHPVAPGTPVCRDRWPGRRPYRGRCRPAHFLCVVGLGNRPVYLSPDCPWRGTWSSDKRKVQALRFE